MRVVRERSPPKTSSTDESDKESFDTSNRVAKVGKRE